MKEIPLVWANEFLIDKQRETVVTNSSVDRINLRLTQQRDSANLFGQPKDVFGWTSTIFFSHWMHRSSLIDNYKPTRCHLPSTDDISVQSDYSPTTVDNSNSFCITIQKHRAQSNSIYAPRLHNKLSATLYAQAHSYESRLIEECGVTACSWRSASGNDGWREGAEGKLELCMAERLVDIPGQWFPCSGSNSLSLSLHIAWLSSATRPHSR